MKSDVVSITSFTIFLKRLKVLLADFHSRKNSCVNIVQRIKTVLLALHKEHFYNFSLQNALMETSNVLPYFAE